MVIGADRTRVRTGLHEPEEGRELDVAGLDLERAPAVRELAVERGVAMAERGVAAQLRGGVGLAPDVVAGRVDRDLDGAVDARPGGGRRRSARCGCRRSR